MTAGSARRRASFLSPAPSEKGPRRARDDDPGKEKRRFPRGHGPAAFDLGELSQTGGGGKIGGTAAGPHRAARGPLAAYRERDPYRRPKHHQADQK